jgi:hypothetical protein
MWILRRVPKTVHSKAPACVKLDNILLVALWDSKTNRSDTKPMVLGESPIGNRERMKLPLPPLPLHVTQMYQMFRSRGMLAYAQH